jgi:hypothetical protein
MGNLIPLFMGLIASFVTVGTYAKPIAFVAFSYLGIGLFGFFENRKIERELRSSTGLESGELVGFVFDVPADALDAHAEIGILQIETRELVLTTEDREIRFPIRKLRSVKRSFNIHALILLGGWIELGFDPPLKLESRKFPTMFQSAFRTSKLYRELQSIRKN